MQRKVAYVFLYKNGIRERSVGIVRRYSTAEQPEVALELFGEEVRNREWNIYYFTNKGALAEASYLWGSTTERGRSEVQLSQCRLCAEAGMGEGIVLLPEELPNAILQGNCTEPVSRTEQSRNEWIEKIRRGELREYLCARYDGKEVAPEELRAALCRKPEQEPGEDPRIESAKRLMEEIAKAAGGELPEARRRPVSNPIAGLEKLLRTKPPYTPCRNGYVEYSVRITPEDLECLPKESETYIHNSYLLHGYYRYRHVLLGRRIKKEREEYVLLVPGTYNGKEAGRAEWFGFPEFLPVRPVLPETDGTASGKEPFGYFCGKI